jgi:hypothetical protein
MRRPPRLSPGDAALILHSSSKGRSENPRRVLHIEYADALELESGIRLALDFKKDGESGEPR